MILLKLNYFSKRFLKTARKSSGVQDFVFLSSYLDFPSNFASRRCHNTSIYTSSKIDQNLHFCQKVLHQASNLVLDVQFRAYELFFVDFSKTETSITVVLFLLYIHARSIASISLSNSYFHFRSERKI